MFILYGSERFIACRVFLFFRVLCQYVFRNDLWQMGNFASSTSISPKESFKNGTRRELSLKMPRSVTLAAVAKPPKPISASDGISKIKANGNSNNHEFHKSYSMHELHSKKKSANKRADSAETASTSSGKPSSLRQTRLNSGGSDHSEKGSIASISSRSASFARQKSIRRADPNHPISASGREIIQFCFETPHMELGSRICSRLYEKRADYQKFIQTMGKDKWPQMTNNLKGFLEDVVIHIDNVETVNRLSRKYGEEHLEVKIYGFKPDFWVSLADAIIIECVILDQATHQPTDTVSAWSQLVSLMFTSIRDGYYTALRAQRISTRKKSLKRQESVSVADDVPPMADSRAAPLSSSRSMPNGLCPPPAPGRGFPRTDSQSPTLTARPIFE